MVVLSVCVHFALAGLGAAWMKWGSAPLLSITPVTTVDLVGFMPPPQQAAPAAEPSPEPPAPPKSKKDAAKEAPKETAPPARPGAMAPHDAKPDSRSVLDAVAAMRARKAAESNAGRAIAEKRAQQELSDMLKKMRDRAARQVNLAAMGSVTGFGPVSGRTPDANSEELKYARALDEKIRDNWTQPVGNARALVAVVRIKIQRDGYVPSSGVEVMRTSGNEYFDRSVERAIMKASPLPVPPDQLRGGETYFDVLLNFYGGGGAW
jgi:colicin import membrane protein